MLKMLYGMVLCDEGEISVFGIDLTKIKPHKLFYIRKKIGFVMQDLRLLFSYSVEDNLKFVLDVIEYKGDKNLKIKEGLSLFGLSEIKKSKVYELSSKEKIMLAFSCAWIKDPELYLVDEVGWMHDKDMYGRIKRVFSEEAEKGKSFIITTSEYVKVFENEKLIKLQ